MKEKIHLRAPGKPVSSTVFIVTARGGPRECGMVRTTHHLSTKDLKGPARQTQFANQPSLCRQHGVGNPRRRTSLQPGESIPLNLVVVRQFGSIENAFLGLLSV